MRREQIIGLDIIRFLAAALVCVYHLGFCAWAHPNSLFLPNVAPLVPLRSIAWLIGNGWVGVQIFFVLSGFVIAYSASGATPRRFAISRIVRLAPGTWICSTIILACAPLYGGSYLASLPSFARTMVFHPFGPWLDGIYWTLGIEISFYTLVFLMLALARRQAVHPMTMAVGLCSAVFILARAAGVSINGHSLAGGGHHRLIQLLLLEHGVFFALGSGLWQAMRGRLRATELAILLLFFGCGLVQIDGEARATVGFFRQPVPIGGAMALFAGAMALMLLAVWSNDRLPASIERLRPVARRIGLATFPLYLLHPLFGASIMLALIRAGCPAWLILSIAVIGSMGMAFTVALTAEPALQRLVRRLLDRVWSRAPGPRRPSPESSPAASHVSLPATAPAATPDGMNCGRG